jgi:hypothetical protein
MKLYGLIFTLIHISALKQQNTPMKKVPIINVYSEDPYRDPLGLKINFEENKFEKERNLQLEQKEQADKTEFRNLLLQQNDLQLKLDSLEKYSTTILNDVMLNE